MNKKSYFVKEGDLNLYDLQLEKQDTISLSIVKQFDFIFAGPPYALATIDELPKKIIEKKLLKPGGWFVLEHTPRNDYKKFAQYKTERNYGTTIFSIFVM